MPRYPITGIVGCCDLATAGHVAALARPVMNSRRRILHHIGCIVDSLSRSGLHVWPRGEDRPIFLRRGTQVVARVRQADRCPQVEVGLPRSQPASKAESNPNRSSSRRRISNSHACPLETSAAGNLKRTRCPLSLRHCVSPISTDCIAKVHQSGAWVAGRLMGYLA
jgi:hypothetical protein